MAKMKRNIGEQVSGKLGNVVFVQMKGKSYVRSAPQRTEEWSDQQLFYRKRLGQAAALWRSINSEAVKKIWNQANDQMNGYAWFIKNNIQALSIDGETIDPRRVLVSDGKLKMSTITHQTNPLHPHTIQLHWLNDIHLKPQRLDDSLMVVGYGNRSFSTLTDTGLKRGDQSGEVAIPELFNTDKSTHLYFFFQNEEQGDYSGSQCISLN